MKLKLIKGDFTCSFKHAKIMPQNCMNGELLQKFCMSNKLILRDGLHFVFI